MRQIPRLIMLLAVMGTASCAGMNVKETLGKYGVETPTVRLKSFDIKAISLRDIDLQFDVEISNPYPVALKLEKVIFQVDVEKKQVFALTTPSGFSVEARGTAVTPLVLNLEFSKIIALVEDFTSKDVLDCDISGELHIPLPEVSGLPSTYKFPFKVSQKIPAIMPEISLANFQVKAPSQADIQEMIQKSIKKNLSPAKVFGVLGGLLQGKSIDPKSVVLEDLDLPLQVNFDIRLKNSAQAKIMFDELNYAFSLNGEEIFSGDTGETRSEGDTLVIRVVNTLSSRKLGEGVLKLFKERKGEFKIKGGAALGLPAIRAEALDLRFEESGSFSM